MSATDEAKAFLERARNDFRYFAETRLKILNEDGNLVPFRLNPPQLYVHEKIEEQRARTGMVRCVILKSRQWGCSSYCAGRHYWLTTTRPGTAAAIVAHVNDTTSNLYDMVKRFHENDPVAPPASKSNIKELEFNGMAGSRYTVYSAEKPLAGHGRTIRCLHLSEAGLYRDLQAVMDGLGNTVPRKPGTEIILESTAQRPYGKFYDMCQDAIRGDGDFQFIFVPFNMDPDCYIDPPEGFEPQEYRINENFPSERELIELHGLNYGQLAWRRTKIGNPRNIRNFARQFPLTVEDAFSADSSSNLISPSDALRARRARKTPIGPVVLGIDPASTGGDRFAIACRQGMAIRWVRHRTNVRFLEGLEWIKAVIDEIRPDRAYIDIGGGGNGDALYSALKSEPEYAKIVRPVNFGSTSQAKLGRPDKPGPKNRRAEMYGRLRDWIESEEGAQIPDEEDLQADLCSVTIEYHENGDWSLTPKDKMKGRSPDLSDACALTFADRSVQLRPDTERAIAEIDPEDANESGRTTSDLSWMAF